MDKTKKKSNILACIVSLGVILIFALILIFNQSREVFKNLSNTLPYIMGFLKFGLLASCGEIFAIRIKQKRWLFPNYFHYRALIWGAIGIAITYMMKVYSAGISALMQNGLLPSLNASDSFWNNLLRAFFTAATMNLTFGPTFMAFHKCTDSWLDLKAQGNSKPGLKLTIDSVNWHGFVSFTLFKTIPIFWIPAHTVTFMLPAEYQVIMAAALSIALGVILSLKKS